MFKDLLSGEYYVERSMVIDKPAKDIFQVVCDLKSWNFWSPWVLHEPDIKIEYSKDVKKEGGNYTWDGKLIGAGKITHTKIKENELIKQKIEFIRPFRSVCEPGWRFEKIDKNTTRVFWFMAGKIPFLFRFMLSKIRREIGSDYEFGLALLNGYVNPKAEHPKVSFESLPVSIKPQNYLVDFYQGTLEEMPKVMEASFPKLKEYAVKNKLNPEARAISVYHKANPKKGTVTCEFGIAVKEQKQTASYAIKSFPLSANEKYLQTNLKGSYHFLKMAWRQAFGHIKMKKLKFQWRKPCLEIYVTDPEKTKNTNNYQTEIYIPIK